MFSKQMFKGIIGFVWLCGFVLSSTLLAEDKTPPTVEFGSIRIFPAVVYAGKTLKISVPVFDYESGIYSGSETEPNQNGFLTILSPSGKKIPTTFGSFDSKSRRIEFEVAINPYAQDGVYQITELGWIQDKAGNLTALQNVGNRNLTFAVRSFNPDTAAPEVDLRSFQVSAQPIQAGDSARVSFKVRDDVSGVVGSKGDEFWTQNGFLMVRTPRGDTIHSGWGRYLPTKRRLQMEIPVGRWATPGRYEITHVGWIKDYAGNQSDWQDVRAQKLFFEVRNDHSDTTPPVIDLNSFELSTNSVVAGGSFTFSVRASDDLSGLIGADGNGAQNGQVQFQGPNNRTIIAPGMYDPAQDRIVFTLATSADQIPGVYRLSRLGWISDNAGNRASTMRLQDRGVSIEVLRN